MFSFPSPISMNMKILLIAFYDITYFLIIVLVFVSWFLAVIIVKFNWNGSTKFKQNNFFFWGIKFTPINNFFLEFIWTAIPIFIFFVLFLPLLKILRLFSGYYEFYDDVVNTHENKWLLNRIDRFWDFFSSNYWKIHIHRGEVDQVLKKYFIDENGSNNFNSMYHKCSFLKGPINIKVIGNQWYWMYERSFDFCFFDYCNVKSYPNNLYNENYNFYEDDIIFSYLSADDDFVKELSTLDENHCNDMKSKFSYLLPDNKDINSLKSSDSLYRNWYRYINSWSNHIRLLSTDTFISVPKDYLVSLFITSYDVLHCWVIPSAGIKVDACPGRLASIRIVFNDFGYYYGQCSELCGYLHGFMPITLKVHESKNEWKYVI